MKISRYSLFKRIPIVTIVAILALGVIGENLCRGRRCKCSAFSIDKQTAIEEGFYIDAYMPVERSFPIPNTRDTITFDSAWTEHGWKIEKRLGLCLLEHKVRSESFNFCIPFTTKSSDINSYAFELKQFPKPNDPFFDPGSLFWGRFNFGIDPLRDTIHIIITQQPQETVNIFSDTLYFVRVIKTDSSN